MEKLFRLMQNNGDLTKEELSKQTGISVEEITKQINKWKREGVIQGRQWIINNDKNPNRRIKALIEVKIKPEAGGGYDRLANRIARFDQVISCSLYSGSYDLLLEVEVDDSLQVATFVFDTLSKIDGVISTQTHFTLKAYKMNGINFMEDEDEERLPVSP